MSKEFKKDNIVGLKPSEFMRGRHPDLYSDSKIINKTKFSREFFEYYLDTLTNRKQEIDFESFCRRISEKEICPNLIPQTGPTGGGDSGVDTETYPVSEDIAFRWHEGIGAEASKERWAFAYSAKKKWRDKVGSDVAKIVDTKRDYKKIFFITTQFVKDKDRAKKEDELKIKYRIDVRILDRNWIVDCVFKNEHMKIAIDTLHISNIDLQQEKLTGSLDTNRKLDLEYLENKIKDPDQYSGSKLILAEDCLQVALIARGLELSRSEVEKYFARAERIAESVGNQQQLLRISYERAWTLFWWYDDFTEFHKVYNKVEDLALGSLQATDFELLTNLWLLLKSSITNKNITEEESVFKERTKKLKLGLSNLSSDSKRPSNALHAKSNLLFIELNEVINDHKKREIAFRKLNEIVDSSQGLIDFSFDKFRKIICELGSIISNSPEYENLFESIVSTMEKRISEGEAGKILLMRGYQELKKDNKYDAIKLFGRAQLKLVKEEYKEDLIQSCIGIGIAYEAAGLFWAARANILFTANMRISGIWRHGNLDSRILPILHKLTWLELQIGRVPHILTCVELSFIIANQLNLDTKNQEKFNDVLKHQDIAFGLLLLKAELWKLKSLEFLPAVLDKLGLPISQMALLFALGHEEFLRQEGIIPEEENQNSVEETFVKGINQLAGFELPDSPELSDSSNVTFVSFILGCELSFQVENNLHSIYLAETILAILEAFFSTSLDSFVFPYRSDFTVCVRKSEYVTGMPTFGLETNDKGSVFVIHHAPINYFKSSAYQEEIYQWLIKILGEIIQNIALITDSEAFTKQLSEEEVFGRISGFISIPVVIENIFGAESKFMLSNWIKDSGENRYYLNRKTSWNSHIEKKENGEKLSQLKKGEKPTPEDLYGIDQLKHKDRRVFSFINIPLWDRADWHGVGYLYPPEETPRLAIIFKNKEFGEAIFKEWRAKLGKADTNEQLRISIITGIDKSNPSFYRVIIGVNPILQKSDKNSQFVSISRFHQMEPTNSDNLNKFLNRYNQTKKYILDLAWMLDPRKGIPHFIKEYDIEKHELNIIEAWRIGRNDLEIIAIKPDDNPLIPDGIANPPISFVLKQKKERKKLKMKTISKK